MNPRLENYFRSKNRGILISIALMGISVFCLVEKGSGMKNENSLN